MCCCIVHDHKKEKKSAFHAEKKPLTINIKIFCIQEEIIEMNNGCICCTVRGDLIEILHRLLQRKDPLDAILIETTGLADPAPVAQTFFVDDFLQVSNALHVR